MQSHAFGVNNAGQIVGDSYIDAPNGPAQDHAFVYQSGKMQDLGTLAGQTDSVALAINNSGTVVGYSGWHAFLYANGAMMDLNSLAVVPGGWTITEAKGINDSGQIVGYATLDSSYGATTHAFLMTPTSSSLSMSMSTTDSVYSADAGTFSASSVNVPLMEPVPEPAAIAALVMPCGALLLRRRRSNSR
jgi:probable HAF family extracellular repeat protein